MPVSKGRKTKPRSPPLPARTIKTKHLAPSQKNMLQRIVNHPIAALICLLAALVGIGELVGQALLQPGFSVEKDADISYPLALPFAVTNNSWIFSMRATQMYCGIDKVTLKGAGGFSQFSVVSDAKATIAPKDKAAFRCVLTGSPTQRSLFNVPPNAVVSAHIFLRVKYATLWFPRTSPETEFTWYTAADPPRWIEGKIVE